MDNTQKLWAIDQIRNLKARYFQCIDTKDWAGLAAIFTSDAVFDARTSFKLDAEDTSAPSISDDWVYESRDAIVAFISEALTDPISVHQGHGHVVEILSETEASGMIGMEDRVITRKNGVTVSFMHGWGHYHERYRVEDGTWKIAHSRITRLDLHLEGFEAGAVV